MDKRGPPTKKKAEGFNTPFQGLKEAIEPKAALPEPPRPPPPRPSPKPAPLTDEEEFLRSAMAGPTPKKKGEGFNNPFKGLKMDAPKPKAAPPPPSRPPPSRPSPAQREEEELFRNAMAGVVPIPDRGSAPVPTAPDPRIVDEEAEALARLAELVSGQGPFDISDSDEFIEGGAPDVDRRLLRALRRGDFAVQGHLDLHGMTRAEARDAVEKFLHASRREGRRCVLLVHGRGLNSKDQIPVLKENLKIWLNRGRLGREVLAFATARPHDGGAGAVYVLLRR